MTRKCRRIEKYFATNLLPFLTIQEANRLTSSFACLFWQLYIFSKDQWVWDTNQQTLLGIKSLAPTFSFYLWFSVKSHNIVKPTLYLKLVVTEFKKTNFSPHKMRQFILCNCSLTFSTFVFWYRYRNTTSKKTLKTNCIFDTVTLFEMFYRCGKHAKKVLNWNVF